MDMPHLVLGSDNESQWRGKVATKAPNQCISATPRYRCPLPTPGGLRSNPNQRPNSGHRSVQALPLEPASIASPAKVQPTELHSKKASDGYEFVDVPTTQTSDHRIPSSRAKTAAVGPIQTSRQYEFADVHVNNHRTPSSEAKIAATLSGQCEFAEHEYDNRMPSCEATVGPVNDQYEFADVPVPSSESKPASALDDQYEFADVPVPSSESKPASALDDQYEFADVPVPSSESKPAAALDDQYEFVYGLNQQMPLPGLDIYSSTENIGLAVATNNNNGYYNINIPDMDSHNSHGTLKVDGKDTKQYINVCTIDADGAEVPIHHGYSHLDLLDGDSNRHTCYSHINIAETSNNHRPRSRSRTPVTVTPTSTHQLVSELVSPGYFHLDTNKPESSRMAYSRNKTSATRA